MCVVVIVVFARLLLFNGKIGGNFHLVEITKVYVIKHRIYRYVTENPTENSITLRISMEIMTIQEELSATIS